LASRLSITASTIPVVIHGESSCPRWAPRSSQRRSATSARTTGSPPHLSFWARREIGVVGDQSVVPVLASAGATATFFLSGASLHRPYRFWWERLQAAVDQRIDLASLSIATPRRPIAIHELGRTIETLPPAARRTVEGELEEIVGPDPPDAGLRAEHLQRLVAAGVEIGFHTLRHDPLPLLDDEDLARAMEDGRRELAALVGRPLTSIAYPHGGADTRVAAAARSAGFEAGFTGRRGIVTPEADPLLLARLSPSYSSLGEFAFDVAWALFRATAQR
jgi:peptidoglycan/xylan/chitin deacetylase (PgdA/CDA1 family)